MDERMAVIGVLGFAAYKKNDWSMEIEWISYRPDFLKKTEWISYRPDF